MNLNYIILLGFLVPFLPLLAFILIITFTKKLRITSAFISISSIFISFIFSCIIMYSRIKGTDIHNIIEYNLPWLHLGQLKLDIGILINNLTAFMLIVVTIVSLLVQIYSIGYMQEDNGFTRFFAYISLFSFSMLGIVVSNNLLQLYIFWELVGLCSYLLIGFWYHKPEAAEAAKKAFVVTRFGDFGFLLGILILTYNTGTFNFLEIENYLKSGNMAPGTLTLIILLLFCGAVGKSGQFPLHVWLPDAMEGPTPVSALIHAATMVAAGVFMVARLFGIFSLSQDALNIIAYIGGFTALFSATIALTQDDIKRVLAYSTLSQLGYMMLALGVSGYT
ncbi:MAG: NADH-quinone oxidoreductase subunit L, partial [Candidatus Goldbacteria bacterium]|nr:NADH-quinone oxidoreductase subunit L [Candidatus Goldiibacteriota bacterium]